MAVKTAAELKAYFETGDVPTQAQFVDLIDTVFTGVPDYKVYRALLTQTGTNAPVATVLENTLGEVPVWAYDSVGFVTLTKTGGFNETKTFVNIGTAYNQSKNDPSFRTYVYTDNKIWIDQFERTAGIMTSSNGVLYYTPFEIKVYN